MIRLYFIMSLVAAILLCQAVNAQQNRTEIDKSSPNMIIHSVSENDLQSWMSYFVSEECRGRLTGDIGFDRAGKYAALLFKEWGLEPGGDNGSYFQSFPHPYTEVKSGGYFKLYLPVGNDWVEKSYAYPDDYIPGGCSDSGELKDLELVYVGYGLTAPELNYDDYKGVNVKGKIVVCEPDVPYQGNDSELRKKWMPYQYHKVKMKNAQEHGAAGMTYLSSLANPNSGWNKGFIYAGVSEKVAEDIFAGTGKNYKETKAKINETLTPISFNTNKKADIKAVTEYHPEGVGYNVVGIIKGTDSLLAPEVIMAGGHLDHVGMMPGLMPGALDNASGSVIIMGAAKAFATSGFKPKRTMIFILYGGEETGLIGSSHFTQNPLVPLNSIKVLFNIDMLGTGYGLAASTAQKFGTVLNYIEKANDTYIKRPFRTWLGSNEITSRPRTDGAVFFQQGVPVISLFSFGATSRTPYHHPGDTIDLINFEIMRDAVKLLVTSMMELSGIAEIEIAVVK
ncbi:MAG: M28 family peptidase [Prevotellaceae bacterium]|jgi:hypothetical protein|nr:M28 family peptidase [Prevotellaceae bacterium]